MLTDVIAYGAGAREAAIDDRALLTKLDAARQQLAAPFAAERVDLVASVAETLLGERRAAASGPAAHFAFWTRRGALAKLAASFAARVPEHAMARPRGLVFHLPPQNVETVFLYSWALSYLAGNANIVRLPQEISARMRAIVDLFLERLQALGDDSRNCSSTIRRRAILERRFPRAATRASSGAATPRSRCSRPCPCVTAESRSGSATASRSRPSTARRSTSWTTPRLARSPRSCTTTCSSSTRWPARRRTRSMSSAKPRLIRRRSGASSTPPRSNGRWTIPPAGSGTRSAR